MDFLRYINRVTVTMLLMSQTLTIPHLPHKAGVILKQLFTKLKKEIIFKFWFQILLSFPRQWAAERTQICSSWFLDRRRTLSFFENTSPSISFKKWMESKDVLLHTVKYAGYYWRSFVAKAEKAQAAPGPRNSVQAVMHSTLTDIEGYLQDCTALRNHIHSGVWIINKPKILILSHVLTWTVL